LVRGLREFEVLAYHCHHHLLHHKKQLKGLEENIKISSKNYILNKKKEG
jgi:hypothetical protein